ncbi:hypothetical protein EON68_03205, partial [archaeon]
SRMAAKEEAGLVGAGAGAPTKPASSFAAIRDQYETIEQVQAALRAAGLESSQLIIGVDCTKSNTWTGAKSFGGRCLHEISSARQNPYQEAISIIGRTLSAFDDDGLIPVFGFGDARTTDRAVFKFTDAPCVGFEQVLDAYNRVIPSVTLAGPTSFAPMIRQAIDIVRKERQYTILVIIADGQVNDLATTEAAIVEASNYPLSIVVVGVGDGPFDTMREWDDNLPARRFDNMQFVDAGSLSRVDARHRDAAFAVAALQEIPDQYKAVQRLRLLR